MKYPTIPTKPWAPYKPQPPAKQINQNRVLGKLTEQENNEFSVQWFIEYIRENFPNEDPSKIKFSMEVNKQYGYYDEVSTSLDFHFYVVETVDNPNYDQLYRHYKDHLKKYEKEYEKYQADLKQYKIDEKKYKEEFDLWQLEYAKQTIARLEEKKAKKSKKDKKK